MSDDCGAGNITGGSSFDCSCGTQTSNDYSSVNECTSNVQTDNDYYETGYTLLTVENTIAELASTVESNNTVINDFKTASNPNSPTKLQANELTTKDTFLKSQSIQDVPSSSNYIRRSDRMRNNHSNYSLSNANSIRIKEERLQNYPRMQVEQNRFRRWFFGMLILAIAIAFLFIITVYIIIFAFYPMKSINKSMTIKPLPQVSLQFTKEFQ